MFINRDLTLTITTLCGPPWLSAACPPFSIRGGAGKSRAVEFDGSDYNPGWEGLAFMRMGRDTQDALPQLLLGAVPQRYPNLTFGTVEARTTWIPPILQQLDDMVKNIDGSESSIRYELLPSEMWRRQGFASGPLEVEDVAGRYEVGVENIAWGSDYPHAEGTWPISRRWVGYLFQDVPREETDLMVAGNAARIFGFDLDKLAQTPAAAQPWPSAEETAKWHYGSESEQALFRELVTDSEG